MCILASCGEKGIDGTWVLKKEEISDGTVLKGKDIDWSEEYKIDGDTCVYTVKGTGLGDTSFDLTVKKIDDDTYSFMGMTEKLEFCRAKFDGDTMSYTIDGLEDERSTFYFERK